MSLRSKITVNNYWVYAAFTLGLIISFLSYRALSLFPAVFVLASIWYSISEKSSIKWVSYKPVLYLIGGLIFTICLSLLWAEFPETSIERTLKLLPLLVIGALSLNIVHGIRLPDVQNPYKIFLNIWFVTIFFVTLEMYFGLPVYGLFHQEPDGLPLAPQLNRFSIIILFFFIFIWHFSSPAKRSLVFLSILPFLTLTQSQSVQLTFLILVIFYVVWAFLKKNMLWVCGLSVGFVTSSFPWLAKFAFANRPENLGEIGEKGAALHRLEIWDAVSTKVLESPYLGYGIENIRETKLEIQNLFWTSDSVLHPHNYALQIWVEFGALGIVIFLAGVVYILYRISKLKILDQRLALGILTALVSLNLTAYGIWQGWWLGLMICIVMLLFLSLRYVQGDKVKV